MYVLWFLLPNLYTYSYIYIWIKVHNSVRTRESVSKYYTPETTSSPKLRKSAFDNWPCENTPIVRGSLITKVVEVISLTHINSSRSVNRSSDSGEIVRTACHVSMGANELRECICYICRKTLRHATRSGMTWAHRTYILQLLRLDFDSVPCRFSSTWFTMLVNSKRAYQCRNRSHLE